MDNENLNQAPQQPKKKKTGLIIGIIAAVVIVLFIGLILLIAIIVGVVIVINGRKEPVMPMVDPGPQVSVDVPDGLNPLAIENTEVITDGGEEKDEDGAETPEVYDPRYTVYQNILYDLQEDIEGYDWDYYWYRWEGQWDMSDYSEGNKIAFADLTGDDKQEMIVVHRAGSSTEDMYKANLDIWDGSSDEPIFHIDGVDYNVGGGGGFLVAKGSEPGTMMLWTQTGDSEATDSYYTYEWNCEAFETLNLFQCVDVWDEDSQTIIKKYYDTDGLEISKDEFSNTVSAYAGVIDEILMYNRPFADEIADQHNDGYINTTYTYQSAYDYVTLASEYESGEKMTASEFFGEYGPLEMSFTSGAGAWGTDLSVGNDGSFTAYYHDSNMGESGDGYDSTVYLASGKGQFGDVVRIGDYHYLTKIESVELDEKPGKEEISVEDDWKVKYVYDNLYGITEGHYMEIFLPEMSVYELPEGFMMWSHLEWMYDEDEMPERLGETGMYDAVSDAGFISYTYPEQE
ncbi:MAG: hypothetical protein K5659_00255 [Lachnospiraceae bacterium]|nr:hypothetical protein [Lachnospiraceae bacterium]